MKTHITSFCFLLFAFIAQAQAQSIHLRDTITDRITTQLNAWPQEKIYLHTDRDYYIPGEKIWFKAYVADAATNQPMAASRFVHVELMDSTNAAVYRTTLQSIDGMYHGYMLLADAIADGYYTIRAYTRYMGNPEEDYIFRKLIRIGSISTPAEQEETKEVAKKADDKKEEDYVVSFFPEGGNLPAGDLSRIAFKAVNTDGYGIPVSGTIVDENGETVTTATTGYAGMGSFAFIPEAEKRYIFRCTDEKGIAKQFNLPQARTDACALSVSLRGGRLSVTRNGVSGKSDLPQHYLLIHCRGQVLHFATWDSQNAYYAFPTDQLPTGILQCLLLDESLKPLSERLVFNRGTDQATLAFSTDKESYKIREKVTADIQVMDEFNVPLKGNFSIAITDDKDIQPDNTNTILSSLLLTSELKGYIEAPGYYFENDEPERLLALDNLMMTQGWRRYNIPEVMKGQIATPTLPFETNMLITGIVKGGLRSKPVVDGEVTLMSIANKLIRVTTTDSVGRFSFDRSEYPDTLNFTLQARNKKKGDNVWLEVDPEIRLPGKALRWNSGLMSVLPSLLPQDTSADPFMEKAKERSKYNADMRVIYLREVEVVAKKINKKPVYSQYSTFASTIIDQETIERLKPSSTELLFRMTPGVMVTADKQIKITRYIQEGGTPLILLNGIVAFSADESGSMQSQSGNGGGGSSEGGIGTTQGSALSGGNKAGGNGDNNESSLRTMLELIPVEEIKAIEIFKGAEAAIFGIRGSSGAINIITYDAGERLTKENVHYNIATLTRMGAQQPVEFYSPVYETEAQRFDILPDLRTTIWWKPDLVTKDDGKASFDFYTSDFPTTYSVVIEGLSDDGIVVRQVGKIQVK